MARGREEKVLNAYGYEFTRKQLSDMLFKEYSYVNKVIRDCNGDIYKALAKFGIKDETDMSMIWAYDMKAPDADTGAVVEAQAEIVVPEPVDAESDAVADIMTILGYDEPELPPKLIETAEAEVEPEAEETDADIREQEEKVREIELFDASDRKDIVFEEIIDPEPNSDHRFILQLNDTIRAVDAIMNMVDDVDGIKCYTKDMITYASGLREILKDIRTVKYEKYINWDAVAIRVSMEGVVCD